MPFDVDATWANSPDDPSANGFDPALNPQYEAGEIRRADAALLAGSGAAPFGARGGVVLHAANTLAVTVDGSDNVTIQAGPVVLPGLNSSGPYRVALPTAYTEALAARNGSNPRVDLVRFRMLDKDVVSSHTARRARLEIVPGDAAGSPSAKPLGDMAVELGRINVPAQGGGAATVDLTNRTFACAPGAEMLVASAARLPATAAPWQWARTLDTGRTYLANAAGTAWSLVETASWLGGELVSKGISPPAGAPKIVREGSYVGAIETSGGFFHIDLPGGGFPNGMVNVQFTAGDVASNLGFLRSSQQYGSLTRVAGYAYQLNGAVVSSGSQVRINYYASGW